MKENRFLALSLILLMLFNFVLFDVHIFSHLDDLKYVSHSVELHTQSETEQNQHCSLCDLFHYFDKLYIKSNITLFFVKNILPISSNYVQNLISFSILISSSRAPPKV